MASQEGHDITLLLHNVCELFSWLLKGSQTEMTVTAHAFLQTLQLPYSGVRERRTMEKPCPRIQLISKGGGYLGREEPGGIMEKLLTIL